MSVNFYPAVILSLLVLGTSFIIIANMIFYSLLGEVNGKRSSTERISMVGVNIKLGRVLMLHAQLFPESKSRHRMKLSLLAGFLFIAAGFIVDIAHYARQ